MRKEVVAKSACWHISNQDSTSLKSTSCSFSICSRHVSKSLFPGTVIIPIGIAENVKEKGKQIRIGLKLVVFEKQKLFRECMSRFSELWKRERTRRRDTHRPPWAAPYHNEELHNHACWYGSPGSARSLWWAADYIQKKNSQISSRIECNLDWQDTHTDTDS